MLCCSLIKLGEGARISGGEEVQLCPKTGRFAKEARRADPKPRGRQPRRAGERRPSDPKSGIKVSARL